MKTARAKTLLKQRGFSLIEMMVGLALGLVAVAVITQTAGVFEGQKSTTTSGVEAQENGLMALQFIQEDIKKSAGGFTNSTALRCEPTPTDVGNTTPHYYERGFFSYYHQPQAGVPPTPGAPADPGGPVNDFSTTPVLIQDGGANFAGSSDSITIIVGRRFSASAPIYLLRPIGTPSEPLYVSSTAGFDIDTDKSPDVYPLAIIARQSGVNTEGDEAGDYAQCTLIKITGTGDDIGPFLKHDNHLKPGSGVDADSPEYNPTDAYKAAHNWPTYPSGSRIFRVGTTAGTEPGLISRTYRVVNGQLVIVEGGAGTAPTTTEAVDGIVQIKAQYGVADAGNLNGPIASWVDAVDYGPAGENWTATPTSPLRAAQKLRIKAVRIAVVARASKRDPALVTQPIPNADCPNTSGDANYGPCAWQGTAQQPAPAIDLRAAADDTEWQHYRYRTYQTIIPVRNVIWTN